MFLYVYRLDDKCINNNNINNNVVYFLLGDSLASEFYMPTFWNTVCSIFIGHVNKNNNWDETARVFIQVKG